MPAWFLFGHSLWDFCLNSLVRFPDVSKEANKEQDLSVLGYTFCEDSVTNSDMLNFAVQVLEAERNLGLGKVRHVPSSFYNYCPWNFCFNSSVCFASAVCPQSDVHQRKRTKFQAD